MKLKFFVGWLHLSKTFTLGVRMKEEVWGEKCLIDPEQQSIKPIQTQIYRV